MYIDRGPHVTAELQHLMSVSQQMVTGQSASPVVRLIQDAVVVLCVFFVSYSRKTHRLVCLLLVESN